MLLVKIPGMPKTDVTAKPAAGQAGNGLGDGSGSTASSLALAQHLSVSPAVVLPML